MIDPYLADLEDRIDPETETQLLHEWLDFTEDRFTGDLFSPKRKTTSVPTVEWPAVSANQAIADYDHMALQQLAGCSEALKSGSNTPLNVRCNYGTGILSTILGAEIFWMDDEVDTLPTSRPLDGLEAIERVLDRGLPDLNTGLGRPVFEMAEHFRHLSEKYPRIREYVHLYHPDVQGPMDICELLWGSRLFLDVVDRPEMVQRLLDLITETYIQFMRRWLDLAPMPDGYAFHWDVIHKGTIMLRDDSAMNFSGEMCDEFVLPYDQRLLDEFGGGAVHFCGKGDHYIKHMCRMPGMHAINLSQPEYNDMETIYRHTVDRGVKLLSFDRATAEAALANGRDLHGHVHCG